MAKTFLGRCFASKDWTGAQSHPDCSGCSSCDHYICMFKSVLEKLQFMKNEKRRKERKNYIFAKGDLVATPVEIFPCKFLTLFSARVFRQWFSINFISFRIAIFGSNCKLQTATTLTQERAHKSKELYEYVFYKNKAK